jgi:hypothetical protein
VAAARHRLAEQGALTAAAVGATYAIWLGLGLPALPIPLLGHVGTDGATRGALVVTEFPKGAIRADAATFAPTPRTRATDVPRRVRAARAPRTHGAVRSSVTPARVPVTVTATAPPPAQPRESSNAPPPAPQPIQEAVATVTSATVTQTEPVPPLPTVTVPSLPDATPPPLPSTPPSDPPPQTPLPPAGLPELPSTPG